MNHPERHARARLPVRPNRRRAGMTLLEVVTSVVILGLVASSLAGALAFVFRSERQQDLRLAAHELASRILLQYLDDETVVEGMRGKPLDYGVNRFRWDIDITRVAMSVKAPAANSTRPRSQHHDRFECVTVRVWLESDQAHGRNAVLDQGTAPLAELSRLLDPAAARNSDAMDRFGRSPARMADLIRRMGMAGGAPTPSNSQSEERPSRRSRRDRSQ